jgi:hypothetical protein
MTTTAQQDDLRRRSLAELDDVIEGIIDRNPDFVIELERVINERLEKEKIDE